ncbi:DUF397 domain-containing protein [Streptomyces sp. Ac-502]|uniref:DUF397 domain-containing protein n=1 Tax=Streptomyces sp. Ac-502 TaxID=3342801 RepID=UPI0038623280
MAQPITTPGLPLTWTKSSYTSAEGGNCLEWSPSTAKAAGTVPVRDSKDPDGPVLTFTPAAFAAFVTGIKANAYSGLRQ